MTYGNNAAQIRDTMAWLLDHHRILQMLGGPGQPTVPAWTDEAERKQMGQIIQRYRHAALTWCLQAVTAVTPKTDLERSSGYTRNPVEDLRYRLGEAVAAIQPSERLSDLLAAPHHNDLIDAWQKVARAAALGEHDFAAEVNLGTLSPEQSRTVVKDAADITRGLVILDKRYKDVPGWVHLKHPVRLNHAADQSARDVNHQGHDPAVDERGWRPAIGIIEGPALPGIAGAVQAQHNLLIELTHFPTALNLRRILYTQARASHEAATHATIAAPDLVDRFTNRTQLYRELVRASRDVAGLVGAGGHAAVESQNAASRLQRTPATGAEAGVSLHELVRQFTRVDARIAGTIEHGFNEKLYFVEVNIPRLTNDHLNGVAQVRHRWMPVTSSMQTPLIGLVRDQLRPAPVLSTPSPPSHKSRVAYEAVMAQQLGRRGHARSTPPR